MKLTRVGFKSLSAEYRALSVEEYQHYKQLGALMTLHSKLNRDASVTKTSSTTTVSIDVGVGPNSDLVLASSTPALMVAGSNFTERMDAFRKLLIGERRENMSQKRDSEQPADTTTDAADAADSFALCDSLCRHGGSAFLDGLRRAPSTSMVEPFRWKLPITSFLQAGLDIGDKII